MLAENRLSYQLELVREQVGDLKALDRTLAGLAKIGAIPHEDIDAERRAVLANRVFDAGTDPAAPERRGNRRLRSASP